MGLKHIIWLISKESNYEIKILSRTNNPNSYVITKEVEHHSVACIFLFDLVTRNINFKSWRSKIKLYEYAGFKMLKKNKMNIWGSYYDESR